MKALYKMNDYFFPGIDNNCKKDKIETLYFYIPCVMIIISTIAVLL